MQYQLDGTLLLKKVKNWFVKRKRVFWPLCLFPRRSGQAPKLFDMRKSKQEKLGSIKKKSSFFVLLFLKVSANLTNSIQNWLSKRSALWHGNQFGNSKIGSQLCGKIGNLICLWHLFRSRAVANIFQKNSCVWLKGSKDTIIVFLRGSLKLVSH